MTRNDMKPSPKALEWKKNNPWFGKDYKKTSLALDIHAELLDAGVVVDSDEYYELLDRKLRLAMNTKAGKKKALTSAQIKIRKMLYSR